MSDPTKELAFQTDVIADIFKTRHKTSIRRNRADDAAIFTKRDSQSKRR